MLKIENINGVTGRREKKQATQLPVELELRDYFAAAALQTIVFDGDYRGFALTAYLIADAMLAERGREPT